MSTREEALKQIKQHIRNSLEYQQGETWITDDKFNKIVEIEYNKLVQALQPRLSDDVKRFEDIKKGYEFIFDNQKMVVSKTLVIGSMELIETTDKSQYIYNGCEKDFKWIVNTKLSDDVEEYIEIIQNSCAECKYSCWYKENYDLDACELNKNMTETNLNASIIGDDCPLPKLIKQHIQTQASEIERLKEENKILNNAYNSVLRDNINVHQKIKNGDFRESCEDWNSKITITSDNDIIDTIGMKYVNCLDKLNAIREAVYSDKPMSYRLAMVKQILDDGK